MELLMPETIDEGKAVDVQKAMPKDLRIAARKLKGKPVWFAVAKDVPFSDKKKISIFVAVKTEAEAKAWLMKLKRIKPKFFVIGTCKLQMKDGKNVEVEFDKVKGDRKKVLTVARLALLRDKATMTFSDPQVEDSADEGEGEEKASTRSVSVSPAVDAVVDKVKLPNNLDKNDVRSVLKQFKDLGLSDADLTAALQETF